MKKLFILVFTFVLFNSCEYRKFSYVGTKTLEKTFIVDEVGPTQVCQLITEAAFLAAMDIPENATITKLDVSSRPRPRAKVYVLDEYGNEASILSVSGYIKELGASNTPIWEKQGFVPLIAPDAPFVGLNSLIANGISKFKGKLNKFALMLNDSAFELCIDVDSSPIGGQNIVLAVDVALSFDIEYELCDEFLFAAGEDCN